MLQTIAIVVSFALTLAALAMLVPAVRKMLGVIRLGQSAPGRSGNPAGRTVTMLKETFLHTRMLQWTWVGIMHWFVFAAFLFLSTAVLAAYFQLFKPDFAWPVVGHWYPYEWFSELIGLLSTIGVVWLIIYRQKHHPRTEGRKSRFFGSTMWQAYFVEFLALFEGSAILFVRAAEWKLDEEAGRAHYPISSWMGDVLYPTSNLGTIENIIFFIAMFKIALAMVWLMVIARNITMGVAWHRFTAWVNIWFKREDDGSVALGAMKPLTSDGKVITLDDIDDLDEDSALGVGKLEDFSWKGILDFTTCTECGRCQSQCPAWNTEKPLSPKLLVLGLRDHAYAKAADTESHRDRALVGSGSKGDSAGAGTDVLDYFYNPADGDFVIDEDVLWSCTSCGACVQQCPVDIEHVDHIMDMRRYQLLVEANFPAELNQLFKGLENKGNPWNMSPNARMDWAKDLPFDVQVVGETIESLDEVDWLFWVGCAGAYEDRAKKTTRAVAELLDIAGVSFGVLGNGETCSGDPARRAGNEFVFQGLAQQNVETFKEYKVKKVVSTCAHCFNTLKNEYKDFGIELEVVHHTQLLNRLVREGKLTPVKDGAGAAKRSITYHDPCYLGRHNKVYEPPRELLQILPGAEYVEMERSNERSFCCGAGGARMWMEENLGERINVNRTQEAVSTGADQIAVGCPFCRVMLADGLTSEQAKGNAREEVEVLDVAQMLLASVKGEQATKAAPGSSKKAATVGASAKAGTGAGDVATKDEPEAGDVTQTEETVTETADVGPLAKASGGSSLFDTPASDEKPAAKQQSGGSLFDTPTPEEKPAEKPGAKQETGGSLFDTPAPAEQPAEKPAAKQEAGGSLFDLAAPAEKAEPEAKAEPKAESKPEAKPAADLGSGGSLFDLAAPAEPKTESKPEAKAEPKAESKPEAKPAADLGSGGSLFDLAAPAEPKTESKPEAKAESAEAKAEPKAAPAETKPEAETEPEAEPAPAEAAPQPKAAAPAAPPAQSIPEGGSLFDIVAPEPAAAAPAATSSPSPVDEQVDEQVEQPEEQVEEPEEQVEEPQASESETTAPSVAPDGAALSQAATEAASDADTEAKAEAEATPAEEPQTEEQAEEPKSDPKPAANGKAHSPKTDVDIHGSGSLFDL
ncbi:(Fe-S)-binding protein [Nocardioides campestrisoli]|uniref:(Fe-S)-binding protein n=1 Tax=Nocardioides campestrisoli TaxID=2736757 RepID=UPI00163D8AD6|nr:(Fe-S)-binding protein [Nocardioides campestrisoli]